MQIYVFIICLFCGVISGVVYDILYVARCMLCGINKYTYTLKDKIFIIICDFLYCITFAAGFIFVSVIFNFEDLRAYMLIGCATGAIIYLKSVHIIVAFFVRRVYNIIMNIKENKIDRRKA